MACLDGYMNIALEQTEEYENGRFKNKFGDAFIRGNNVLYISIQKRDMWTKNPTEWCFVNVWFSCVTLFYRKYKCKNIKY